MLPARRKAPRSGIMRGPRRVWPRHEKFVRGHICCVPGCQGDPIVFAHIRSAANSGKALKPASWYGISLCDGHHKEQHRGDKTFSAKYGIDVWQLAAEFARRSPDLAMRAAMREAGHD